MFSFRHIAEETRRMRAFTRFLKEGGQSLLPNALHHAAKCPALCRVQEPEKPLWPDIYSLEGARTIAQIVQSLKPVENRRKPERAAGTRRESVDVITIDDDISPEEEALAAFLSSLPTNGTWQSAGDWAEQTTHIVRAEFLECVLTWSQQKENRNLYEVRFKKIHTTPFMANISIGDIEVCRTA
jgi:hypothetical protein